MTPELAQSRLYHARPESLTSKGHLCVSRDGDEKTEALGGTKQSEAVTQSTARTVIQPKTGSAEAHTLAFLRRPGTEDPQREKQELKARPL